MSENEYLKLVYKKVGGEQKTGDNFDSFTNNINSDPEYAKLVYKKVGGKETTGDDFDSFMSYASEGYVKKKDDSVSEQQSMSGGSGNGSSSSQDSAAIKEMLTPVDEIAFTEKPSYTPPTPQQVSDEQFKEASGIDPVKEGLPKQGYKIGEESIPNEILHPSVDPKTGLVGKADKKSRENFRNQIKESFLTPEEKEDATLFEMMTRSGVNAKSPTPEWQDILNKRSLSIDQLIQENESKKSQFGVGSPNWNTINERTQQLQSRKDYFVTPPELKIDQAIVKLGGTIDGNTDANRYEQLTRKVEEKFAELQEVNKLIKENYSNYPFSESLIGGLHGMGTFEDSNRKRREELTKELKDVAPIIFTGLNPNLDKDTFTDTFVNAITPDVVKESTNQEKSRNIEKVLNDIGVNLSPEDADKIKSASKEYELNDPAYAGELIGNTVKIGAKIYAGSALAGSAAAGLGLNTLLNGTKALNMYKSSQYVKNITKGAASYGVAGNMFGDQDDLNVFSGAMMGLGGTAATALISKIPSQVKDNFLKEFSSKITKAVATGTGEVATETLEQGGSYINQAVKEGSFDKIGEYIDRDFRSYSDVVKFIASSFAMGLPGSIAIDDYKNLSNEDKLDLNEFLKNASEYQDKSDLVNFNSEDLEGVINTLRDRKDAGEITPEKFTEYASSSQLIATVNEQIFDDMDLMDKVKTQSLLIDKHILEDKIKGKNPDQKDVIEIQDQIDDIKKQLNTIGGKMPIAAEDTEVTAEKTTPEKIAFTPKPQTDVIPEQSTAQETILNQPEGSTEVSQGGVIEPKQEVADTQKEVNPDKIAFTETSNDKLFNLLKNDKFKELDRKNQNSLILDSEKESILKGRKLTQNFSNNEINALDIYTSSSYNDINGYLRDPENEEYSSIKSSIESAIKDIDSAISKNKLDEDLIVYRSLKDSNELKNDKSYQSTSLDPYSSHLFKRDSGDIFAIKIPKGTNYAYIGGSEKELLLPRGIDLSKFIVDGSDKIAFTPITNTNEEEKIQEGQEANVLEEDKPSIEKAVSVGDLDGFDYNDDTFLDKAIKKLDEWDNDLDNFQKNNLGVNIAPALVRVFIKTLKETLKATRNLQQAIQNAYKSVESTPEYINLKDNEKQDVQAFLETIKQSKIKVKKGDVIKATEGKMSSSESKSFEDYYKTINKGINEFKKDRSELNKFVKDFLEENDIKLNSSEFKKISNIILKTETYTSPQFKELDQFLTSVQERSTNENNKAEQKKLKDYFLSKKIGTEQFKESRAEIIDKYVRGFLKENNIELSYNNIERLITKVNSVDIDSNKGMDQVDTFLDEMLQRENVEKFKVNKRKIKETLNKGAIVDNTNIKYKDLVKRLLAMSQVNQTPEFINLYNKVAPSIINPKKIDTKTIDAYYDELNNMYIEQSAPEVSKLKTKKEVDDYLVNKLQPAISQLRNQNITNYDDYKKYKRLGNESSYEKILNDIYAIRDLIISMRDNYGVFDPESTYDYDERFTAELLKYDTIIEDLKEHLGKVSANLDKFEKARFINARALIGAIDKNLFTKEENYQLKSLIGTNLNIIDKMTVSEIEDFYLAAQQVMNGMVNKHVYDTIAMVQSKSMELMVDNITDKVADKLSKLTTEEQMRVLRDKVTTKNFAAFESLFDISKIGDRPVQEFVRPIISAIVRAEVDINRMQSKLFDAYNEISNGNKVVQQLTKNIPLYKKKIIGNFKLQDSVMRQFRIQIGLMLTQRRYEQNPVSVDGKKVKWEDLPKGYKDKFAFLYNDVSKSSSRDEASDYYKNKGVGNLDVVKQAYDGLIKKTVDGVEVIDTEANIDLLKSDPKTAKLLEVIEKTLVELEGKSKVVSQSKGIDFIEEGFTYFPQRNAEGAAKRQSEQVMVDPLGGLSPNFQSAISTPGSAYKSTRGIYFTEYDFLDVMTNHISDVNNYYEIAPKIKAAIKSIDSSKKKAELNAKVDGKSKEEIDRLTRFLNLLDTTIKGRITKTFAEHKNSSFVDKVGKVQRRMLLGNPVKRFAPDFLSNAARALLTPEVLLELNSNSFRFNDWGEVMDYTDSPVVLKYNRYSEGANPKRDGKLARKVDEFIGLADTPISKAIWINSFKNNFERITGDEFKLDDFLNLPDYKFTFEEQLNKASMYADLQVNEMMNSQSSFYKPEKYQYFPWMKPVSVDNTTLKALYYLQSWTLNDTTEFFRRGKDLALGTNEGRSYAAKRLAGLIGSNMAYQMTSGFIYSLITNMLDDDEDERNVLLRAYNDMMDKTGEDFIASVTSLSLGKYGWLVKYLSQPLMVGYDSVFLEPSEARYKDMKKKGLISKEEFNEKINFNKKQRNFFKDTFYELFKSRAIIDWGNIKADDVVRQVPMIGSIASDALKAGKGFDEHMKYINNRDNISKSDRLKEENRDSEDIYSMAIIVNMMTMAIKPTPIQPLLQDYFKAQRRSNIEKIKSNTLREYEDKKMDLDKFEDLIRLSLDAVDRGHLTKSDQKDYEHSLESLQSKFYKSGELKEARKRAYAR